MIIINKVSWVKRKGGKRNLCQITIVGDPSVELRQQDGHDVMAAGVEGRHPDPAGQQQPLRLRQRPGQERVGRAPDPLPRERTRHRARPPREPPQREQQRQDQRTQLHGQHAGRRDDC